MNLRTIILSAKLGFARNGAADAPISLASVTLTSASPTLTCTSTTGVIAGAAITGSGIPSNTTVLSVTNSTTLVLSANATSSESASTASVTNLSSYAFAPADGSPAYTYLGHCPNLTISPQGTMVPVTSPFNGIYAHRKTIPQVTGATVSGSIQDFSPLAHESLFRLNAPAVIGTAQQPFLQSAPITGWLDVTAYDQTQTVTLQGLMYVEWFVNTYQIAMGKFGFEFSGQVIFNSSNTINLASLAADAY